MQIRITVPVLQYGPVQWTRGQIAIVPEELGQAFIDLKEAVLVPTAEHSTLPSRETAAMPRPVPQAKPKPQPLTRIPIKARRP